jgi:hypothetical protein
MMSPTSVQAEPRKPPIDVNVETYPYDVVQYLLDQTATFTWYATPVPGFFEEATLTPADPKDYFGINGGYGVHLNCDLHPFDSATSVPRGGAGLAVQQAAGAPIGRLRCILLFAPQAHAAPLWHPGAEPAPAIFDRWRSQRFVLSNPEFTFYDDERFRGYGVGRTYPSAAAGPGELLFGAVGNVTQGTGAFANHEGLFAFCGRLTANLGFEGLITCRLPDPVGDLRREESPELEDTGAARGADTFILLHGQKKDRTVRTEFGPDPGPNLQSLVTPSQMRAVYYGSARPGRALFASRTTGAVVCGMTADVHFNLNAPPGTAAAPGRFTTNEIYEFVDDCGRALGVVHAQVEEGISFGLRFPAAPGQPGVRFTGFGSVTGGTGAFADARGLLTVNSVIGIAPHALSLTHVLHLVGPRDRFRAGP